MALIQCPECDRKISDMASSCPHCGYPLTDEVQMSNPSDINLGQNWNDPNFSYKNTTQPSNHTLNNSPMSDVEREFYQRQEPPISPVKPLLKALIAVLMIATIIIAAMNSPLLQQDESTATFPKYDAPVTALGGKPVERAPDKSTTAAAKKAKLELLGETTPTSTHFALTISGTLRNNSAQTYRNVQIKISFYDINNELVGNALSSIDNLQAGSIWEFEAKGETTGNGNVRYYKITEISAS